MDGRVTHDETDSATLTVDKGSPPRLPMNRSPPVSDYRPHGLFQSISSTDEQVEQRGLSEGAASKQTRSPLGPPVNR